MARDPFFQQPDQVNEFHEEFYAGQQFGGDGTERTDAINADGRIRRTVVLDPSPSGGGETFGFTIEDYVFSHTVTGDADTPAEVVAELAVAINADPGVATHALASPGDAGTTLILSGHFPGTEGDFQLGSLVGSLTIDSETAAADAQSIEFGTGVLRAGAPSSGGNAGVLTLNQRRGLADQFCKYPDPSDVSSKTFSLDDSYTDSEVLTLIGSIKTGNGEVPVMATGTATPGDSTPDAALTALAGAFNALYGPWATAAAAGNDLTITYNFGIGGNINFVLESGTSLTLTEDGALGDQYIGDTFLGVAYYSYDEDTDTFGTFATAYSPGRGVKLIARGRVGVVLADGTPATPFGQVYFGVQNADRGKFFATPGNDRTLLPTDVAFRVGGRGDKCVLQLRKGN